MKLSQKQAKFAVNVASLINYIDKHGYSVTFGETYRTQAQADIYAREGKGIHDSLHCKRLAVDLMLHDGEGNFITEPTTYKEFGEFWKSLDPANRHGGDFKRVDSVHFEMQDL